MTSIEDVQTCSMCPHCGAGNTPGGTALNLVTAERARQDAMWGGVRHDDLHDDQEWFAILCRQETHIAEAIQGHRSLPTEIAQLIAVGLAWLESDARRREAYRNDN